MVRIVARKFKKYLLLVIFLIIVVVFISGIILGYSWSSRNISEINKMLMENELNAESYVIEQDIFAGIEGEECSLVRQRTRSLSSRLTRLGQALSEEDVINQMDPIEYDYLKRKYHLSQIKTYTFIKKIQERCNISSNVILFFYSTKEEESIQQGKILDKIAVDYNASIFSVQFHYSPELYFFEDYYKITETPSLVINFDTLKRELTSYEDIAVELENG